MKTLAFDTSTKFLSIACFEGAEIKASFHKDVGISHSELLIPEVKNLINSLGWNINEIGLICVGLGPGSFTGLRIGVSAVKGLALVMGCKITGVPTMDAMVKNITGKNGLVAPFMDARKGKVYTCVYKISNGKVQKLTDYSLVEAKEFLGTLKEEVMFFGDGLHKYKDELDSCVLARYNEKIDWYPKGVDIGLLGIDRKIFTAAEDLEPLYLHPKECNVVKL
ncbi:MAG: tRNA (adenosine(37)-N6)-threonylcarbamoyltransferase complex dimerization subunit type 1 TsaB [Candidatus Omnitrophota bacterium]